jgi:2-polyprenyl-6-methoxyphenol hydroxylase-like FAD-dependent oxidoreductase
MPSLDADVLIVGGGPVGMGLAIELGQRGIRVVVIERHAEPQRVPKGQNLTQRTMEHFHAWGAERQLRTARTIPAGDGICGVTAYGSLLSGRHYDWLRRGLVERFYHTANERLPQYATEAVLRTRAAEIPTVDIRYEWTGQAVREEGDTVRLTIAPRAGGAPQTLTGSYLVGCDGSHSTVRGQAGISQTLADHDRLMVLLVFRSKVLSQLLARAFPGKSFFNVLHPSQRGYWLFLGRVGLEDDWFFHAPVPPEARKGGTDFAALLQAAVGAPFDVALDHVGFWDLRFANADRYAKGRIFLAGDAAHSHPPYGGYGINTGFEDARNLGWKLAATLQGWGGPGLLESYHVERHGVFASTARDFIEKSINADRDFLETYDPSRDAAAFNAAWAARSLDAEEEVDRFEPHYAGSPIVMGEPVAGCSALGHHRLRADAGHHLAPQPLSSGGDAYGALGPDYTLLAFDADPAAVDAFTAAAAHAALPLTVVHDTYAAPRDDYAARLILVRPDGFVAWAGDQPAPSAGTILKVAAGTQPGS